MISPFVTTSRPEELVDLLDSIGLPDLFNTPCKIDVYGKHVRDGGMFEKILRRNGYRTKATRRGMMIEPIPANADYGLSL